MFDETCLTLKEALDFTAHYHQQMA